MNIRLKADPTSYVISDRVLIVGKSSKGKVSVKCMSLLRVTFTLVFEESGFVIGPTVIES